MEVRDQSLPDLDDLEQGNDKLISEADKNRGADRVARMEARACFTAHDVLKLVKERVSIFSIFNLHDEMEMQ